MTRREFVATTGAAAASRPPNVLLILCDQLNASVTSVYGGPVPTPNLERIARRGVVFTEAVCTTPFCSPARASIVTGLYPHTHGIVYNVSGRDYPAIPAPVTEEGITVRDVTTDKILHEAGYQVHQYGKWHLDGGDLPYYRDMYGEHREYAHEMKDVFAQVRKAPCDTWMDWYGWALPVDVAPAYRAAVRSLRDSPKNAVVSEFIAKLGKLRLPLSQVFDARVADQTIDRFGRLTTAPFVITCSFNYPHDPNVVPSPYYEAFDPTKIELPANHGQREARFEKDWSRRIVAETGETGLREFLRVYYSSVRLLDDQVGRVLDALERTGRADDTVIVFTADHGDMAGSHGMVWKSTQAFYDGIARIPLIVSYPRQIKPGRSARPASQVDLMPTLLELAGRAAPAVAEGRSLLSKTESEYVLCERVAPNSRHTRTVAPGAPSDRMIRGQGWKYIRYRNGEEFLYHLAKDPGETRNLAGDPACQATRQHLSRRLAYFDADRESSRENPACA